MTLLTQRQLRKEILHLKARVYRAEIRRETQGLADVLGNLGELSGQFIQSSLWQWVPTSNSPLGRGLRWAALIARVLPLLMAVRARFMPLE